MDLRVNNTKVLLAGILTFISGILHLIVSVLSLGLLILVGTTLIFGICFVLLGIGMILLVKKDILDETRKLIIFSATISFLNIITLGLANTFDICYKPAANNGS